MFSLADFKAGDVYMNGDGEYISKEEAQAEVEWLNDREMVKVESLMNEVETCNE